MPDTATVLYDFDATGTPDGLSVPRGAVISVQECYEEWVWAKWSDTEGFVPRAYIQIMKAKPEPKPIPTPESPKKTTSASKNAAILVNKKTYTSATKSATATASENTTTSANGKSIVSATVKSGTFKRDPELDAMLKRKEKIASAEVDYRTLGTKARDMTLDSQSQDGSAMNTMTSWSSQDSRRKYEFKRNPDLDEALQRSQRKMESSSPPREANRTYTFGRDPDLDAMLKRKAQVASCVVPNTNEVDPNAIRNAQPSIVSTDRPSPREREYDLRNDFKPSTALWQSNPIPAGNDSEPQLEVPSLRRSAFESAPAVEPQLVIPAGKELEGEVKSFDESVDAETPSESVDGIPAGKEMGRETMMAMEEIMGDLDLSLEDMLSGGEEDAIPVGGEEVMGSSETRLEDVVKDVVKDSMKDSMKDPVNNTMTMSSSAHTTLHSTIKQPLAVAYADTPVVAHFASVLFDFTGQSAQELSVRRGDVVRVVEEAGPWTCVATARGDEGFVPSNYMQSIEGSSRRVRAIYEYAEDAEDRLPLFVGDIVTLIDEAEGWFQGYNESGKFGWFPQSFVEDYS